MVLINAVLYIIEREGQPVSRAIGVKGLAEGLSSDITLPVMGFRADHTPITCAEPPTHPHCPSYWHY